MATTRTTGILPVPEHGLEGRGTKFVRPGSKRSVDLRGVRSAVFHARRARQFGSLLPPHGIACRLTACPVEVFGSIDLAEAVLFPIFPRSVAPFWKRRVMRGK